MIKRLASTIAVLMLVTILGSVPALAGTLGTLALKPATASVGTTVTASGTSAPDTWVAVKVVDGSGDIVFFDEVKSDSNGGYTCAFKVPSVSAGTLDVVAGYGDNVAVADLTVANSSGSGGISGGGAVNTLAITTSSLPAGTVGRPYKETITTNGAGTAPYTFAVTSGSLPPGLSLGSSTGAVAGSPTTAGTYTFTITVKDQYNNSASQTYTLKVNGAAPPALPPKAAVKPSLTDIAGNWARADIVELFALGIITGYPDGTFRPNNDVTRAEFTTMLVKALELTPRNGHVFADTRGTWAQSYISTAAADGIVKGYDAARFGPNDLITREQMTAMVVRAAKLTPVSGELPFQDADTIDAWAKADVITAWKDGLIHGYPDNTFRPLNHATRAEAAAVIAGLLKLK